MKKKFYFFIGLVLCIGLLGFSKVKKKEKIDKAVYKYECIYEVKTKADTFKYSVSYDDSEDSMLTINHSFLEYGGTMSGYLIKCKFIRNEKNIDTMFITGENLKLKYAFTKFEIRDYRHTEKYLNIPLDTIKFNKHTLFTIDGYDKPATITTYIYRCKHVHATEELEKNHKLIFPNTKTYSLIQNAEKYRDTCDCKLENRIYKEF